MNTNDGEWSHCAVCGGRIHEDDCKGRKVKGRDCFGQEKHSAQEMLKGFGGSLQEWLDAGHHNEVDNGMTK